MRRRIVTGDDVRSLPEGSILDLPPDAILTDIAREWIQKKRLKLVRGKTNPAQSTQKARVALGSDHAGFDLKEAVKEVLGKLEASFMDYGTHSTQSVDYPDFAHNVARAVALGQADMGIIVDGAGIGSAIAANKVPGIRAAPCLDEGTARNSREHNDANVLTLGARFLSEDEMAKVVRTFLTTNITEGRHRRRVGKIVSIERKYFRPV
jgi:ribose 5-phosphate isomerase B